MKFIIVALVLVAGVYADVSELSSGYGYQAPVHHEEASLPIAAPHNTYIPPAPPAPPPPPPPQPEYIPPPPPPPPVHHEEASLPIPAPVNTYIPPAEHHHHEEHHHEEPHYEQPAEDGYHYRTVRRRVFRHRA